MYPVREKGKCIVTMKNGQLYPVTDWFKKMALAGVIHKGVDIAPKTQFKGEIFHIIAPVAGKIALEGLSPSFGRYVVISFGDGFEWHLLGHLMECWVKKGESVNKGDEIGIMGSTGTSSGKHTHYQVSKTDYFGKKLVNIDPKIYLT